MNKKILVIFEMANNHMGDLAHAKKILNHFSKLSKKFNKYIEFAFKFQFRDLDTYIHESFKDSAHQQVKRFLDTKFSNKEWEILINYCKSKNFLLIGTAFDEKSVDKIIQKKFDYLKIASCSMDEWPLLEYIAKKNVKKIICSLGGGTKSSIRNNISFFSNKKIPVKYLYCVAKYPTENQNLNLEYFKYLKEVYPNKVYGFSTHEDPNELQAVGLAYAMGARIFEKHVGLRTKQYKLNKYSSDLSQTESWLQSLSNAIKICGSNRKREEYLKEESKNLAIFKRGVYLKKNNYIKKNQILNIDEVDFAFPSIEGQIHSNDFSKFKTLKSKTQILPGMPILRKNIKILDNRRFSEKVRDKIISLIDRNSIIINKLSKLEISHHYGIKNFYKFGLSMITIHNSDYCKKILFLFYKQKHPAQFHKVKKETFFLIFGKIKLQINIKNRHKVLFLSAGDTYTLNPYEVHTFEAVSRDGAIIEELSTASVSEDSFYIDPKINNNKDRKSFISLN